MKARSLLAGLAVAVFTLAGAVSANAAPSSTGELTLVGKGAIYKEAQRPVDLTLDVAVTPEQGALTLKPLANVTVKFPVGLDLVADDKKTEVCPTSKVGPANSNFTDDTARTLCPKSLVGDGNADLFLAQATSAPVSDSVLTLFNGGIDSQGNTIVAIHGYSASLNQGIYMTGAIKNGNLSVDIPRLTGDSSVSRFQINIPGGIGQDPGYARAACPSGHWDAIATITLANRDSAGTVSNQEVLDPPAQSNKTCSGLAGRAQFSGLKIKAPKKVKNGRKGAFKVTVTNKGTASSKKGKIKASGAGKGSTKLPALKPGASKTVTVKAKVTGKKGRKAVVKFKASGGASASGKAKVKVG
jgi:hypothetical protein